MHYHHSFGIVGFFGSLLMIIMMALPLIFVVWLSFYLYDLHKDRNVSTPEEKLAKGEISIEEYRQRKK
jgi:uncharacterized membrane protein